MKPPATSGAATGGSQRAAPPAPSAARPPARHPGVSATLAQTPGARSQIREEVGRNPGLCRGYEALSVGLLQRGRRARLGWLGFAASAALCPLPVDVRVSLAGARVGLRRLLGFARMHPGARKDDQGQRQTDVLVGHLGRAT